MPYYSSFGIGQEFLIPFLFTLAIIFGALRYARVFGNNTAVQMIIALVLAYFASTYEPFVSTLYAYFPGITWFFIAMFFIAFIMEIFGLGKRAQQKDHELNMFIYGILLLVLLTIGISQAQAFGIYELPLIGSLENLAVLLGIIFIIGIFYFAYKSETGG